ncbi:Ku protein [Desulfosporosinus lacus]|uniref:Ku protein n=1 Tax=Desulfosporosinus lacus TaxID=329936 RepID=UPI0011611125
MSFDQLHEADYQRIRYKKISEHCGAEVSCKSILQGYEYDKDKYVIVTDNNMQINPIWAQKSRRPVNLSPAFTAFFLV